MRKTENELQLNVIEKSKIGEILFLNGFAGCPVMSEACSVETVILICDNKYCLLRLDIREHTNTSACV